MLARPEVLEPGTVAAAVPKPKALIDAEREWPAVARLRQSVPAR